MRVAQARETDVPRSLRFGKFGFKGFAAAGKCANALTDAGQFFRGVRRLEQGIQVGQGAYNVYDGYQNGSVVQMGLGLFGMKAGIRGTQLPCFVAGTLVSTPDGLRPIETILSGDTVWGFDQRRGQWRSCMVSYHSQIAYDDLVVTVRSNGDAVRSTYHHPYWVISGEELDQRPVPDQLDELGMAVEGVEGRWVDAGDLQPGDLLLSRTGPATVDAVETEQVQTTVYHIYVEDLHNYAVGDGEWLVHNGHGDLEVTGFTKSGKSRVNADWRAKYGPSAMRRHHLVPQELLKNPAFTNRMRRMGYTPDQVDDFVHRQVSDLTNAKHSRIHADGWNPKWNSWLESNPHFTMTDLRTQIRSMVDEFDIPLSSLGGPRY